MNLMLSRRGLLGAGAAAAAASLMSTPRLFAARTAPKSGLVPPVLGVEGHRYECIHDWLKPPHDLMWGDTHGLAQDEAGRIYVAHTVHGQSTRADAVAVFSESGVFETAWGASFRGGAHGLDIRREGDEEFLYHCDTNRRLVVKTNLKGETLWERGTPVEAKVYDDSKRFVPTNVAFLPGEGGKAGDVLVGDGYGASYVHRFTADGAFVKVVLEPGSEPGKVSCPHGLWVDERSGTPRLAVADRGNRRLQYFTLDGKPLGIVTQGLRMPCHFKTRGDVLLVPDLESVVTLLDANDKVIAHLGDGHPSSLRGAPREQFIEGKFIHPHTAIFLRNGDILVAEWVPVGRVTLLRKVG